MGQSLPGHMSPELVSGDCDVLCVVLCSFHMSQVSIELYMSDLIDNTRTIAKSSTSRHT